MARRGAKLGTSVLDLDIDDSRFHSKMSGAYTAAQNFTDAAGKNLVNAGRAISGVGQSWTRNITLPIVAAGGVVTKFGLDFDTTLRQVVGLTDVTSDEIAGIREEIMKLGPEVGKGPQELAEAFYFVASAGFKAEEAMEVLRVSAVASATGLGETKTIAQVLGGVINAYGRENITAARAGDILTEAVSQGTAEASGFAAVIGNVVPGAAALGVSFDQVTAAMAGMTLSGVGIEESATSLIQIFSSLQKPTVQAEEALEALGLSSAGLRRQLREEGLLSTLRTLEERFAGNETASAAVFGNIRALRGVTALLTLDADQLNTVFAKVEDSTGRLGEAYDETEGPQRELDRSMAQLEATAIEIGNDVLPMVVEILGGVADAAKNLSEWWSSLDAGTKQLIIQSLAMLAVMGPLLVMVGKLTTGAGMLFKTVAFLGGPKGIPKLTAGMGALLGPLGLAIGLLTTLAIVGEDVYKSVNPIGHAFNQLASQVKRSRQEVEGDVNRLAQEIGASAESIRERMIPMLEAGLSWEEVVRNIESGMTAIEWEKHVAAMASASGSIDSIVEAMAASTTGALDAAALEAAGLPPEIAAILSEEARKAAVQSMSSMLAGMVNLFDSDDTLRDAWQALLERADDPYTEAERRADIFGQNTIDNIHTAIESGDPGLVADTVTLVTNMLDQFAMLAPGVLQSGEAVPPALREGMDAHMQELIDFIETNVTGESLSAMSLEEAEELGLTGIWLYAQGMRQNEKEAADAARDTALAAREALEQVDWEGLGATIPGLVGRGITENQWKAQSAVAGMAQVMRDVMVSSEPKDPRSPLRGITDAWGFVDVLAGGLRNLRPLEAAMADVAGVMRPDLAVATPHLTSAGGIGYQGVFDQRDPYREMGAGGGGDTYDIDINAPTVPATPRDIGRELRRTGVFGASAHD